jgi:hypothetical protein
MALTRAQQAPVRRLNPALLAAVRSSGIPAWQLALRSGWPHLSGLSTVLHSDSVRATPLVERRLRRLADLLLFPTACLYLDPETPAASVASPVETR